jgi:hypothetical protein
MKRGSQQRTPYLDDLMEALVQPGCPFCRLLNSVADRYIDKVLFEMVNDVRVRDELNRARGYCRRHSALLVRTGGALGSATMMQGVIKVLLRELAAVEAEAQEPSRWRALMRPVDPGASNPAAGKLGEALAPLTACPVCAAEATVCRQLADALGQHLQPGSPLETAYRASDGLCLPHFRETLTRGLPNPAFQALVSGQRAVWLRLNGELDEFLRRSDYRFSKEPFGAERDSWRRAIAAVSGSLPDPLMKE